MPAVQSVRVIKRKIRSVNNIKKITRAMQMVSAAKLKKVQERLMQLRPYASKIRELLEGLVGVVNELRHPLFTPRPEIHNIGIVVIMAEKGLCGSFNSNMIRSAHNFIEEKGGKTKITAIGKKAVSYFQKRNYTLASAYENLPTEVPFAKIAEMTRRLVISYEKGEVDEIYILYTHYVNALVFKPTKAKFLPIESEAVKGKVAHEYIFEPEPAKILDSLIPRYLETTFHHLLLESMSSEHAARMNAMRNATDNAEELIDDLTMTYNKARQAGITKELLDIVGGAEALK